MIVSSVTFSSGLALSRIDPRRKNGCCGMVLIFERTFALDILEMSVLSIKMEPQLGSSIRSNADTSDDLPLARYLVLFHLERQSQCMLLRY